MFSMYGLWVRWQSSVKFQLFTPAYKNLSCCNFQLSVKFQIIILLFVNSLKGCFFNYM